MKFPTLENFAVYFARFSLPSDEDCNYLLFGQCGLFQTIIFCFLIKSVQVNQLAQPSAKAAFPFQEEDTLREEIFAGI